MFATVVSHRCFIYLRRLFSLFPKKSGRTHECGRSVFLLLLFFCFCFFVFGFRAALVIFPWLFRWRNERKTFGSRRAFAPACEYLFKVVWNVEGA